jgi:hypothetical protein
LTTRRRAPGLPHLLALPVLATNGEQAQCLLTIFL